MKIYIGHSSAFDFQNDLYIPIRSSQINKRVQIFLPHEYKGQQFDSLKLLKQGIDLFIAEVSYPSTGLGIELGWANLLKIETIGICRSEARPSSALGVVVKQMYYYSPYDLVQVLEKIIK